MCWARCKWRSCSRSTAASEPPRAGTETATRFSRTPKNRLALVWLSTWDSEDDAREFAHAYVAYQSAKVGDLGKPPKPIPDSVWRNLDDRLFVVQRRGRNVAVVEGFSARGDSGLDRSRIPGQTDRGQAGRAQESRLQSELGETADPCEVNRRVYDNS